MNEHQKIIVIIIALFILAIGMRMNMISQNDFFEPDQSWEARMIEQTLLYGHALNPDLQAYFSVGYAPQTFQNPLWNLSAEIYNITIGWWAGFNEEYFTKLMQILPAIFGALTCLILYFIGKAVSNENKVVGLITMFVAAVTPGYIYRTMLGAQETNAFGFLPITIGILLLIWAFNERRITRKSLILTFLSGASFIFSVYSWSMYLLIPLILLSFWGYRVCASMLDNKINQIIQADLFRFIVIFSLFWVACMLNGFNWIQLTANFIGIPTLLLYIFTGLIIFGGSALMYLLPNFSDNNKNNIKSMMILIFIVIVIGIAYFTTLNIDPRDLTSVGSMVGEESLGHNFFLQKFNIFNLFIPFAMISGIIIFIWKWRDYEYMPMIFSGFLIFFIMGWIKLKFCYVLGFGISFAAIIIGILAYELWAYLKDKNKLEMKIIFIPAACILLFGLAAGGIFIQDYNSILTSDPGLVEVIKYIDNNVLIGSNIMNAWSYGHVLTYNTKDIVLTDNRNYSPIANAQFAIFENDSNIQKVYQMVKEIGVDYILIQPNDFYGLQQNEFYIANKVDSSLGKEFTKGVINIMDCSRNGTILTCPNSGIIDENGHTQWTSIPFDFYNGTDPIYLYILRNKVYILNKAANETNLAKVLMMAPEIKGKYEIVFNNESYILIKVLK